MEQDFKSSLPDSAGDAHLWEIAKRRASFKYHLATYIIINLFLWTLWVFSNDGGNRYPWPVWTTGGWGIGLFFHYLGAYVFPQENSVQKEYEKLLKEK